VVSSGPRDRPARLRGQQERLHVREERLHDQEGRLREREKQLMDAWGGDLYEDLLRLNQLDMELFRRAQKEIERRVALVPQFQERLAEFRTRCSRLQQGCSHAGAAALRTAQEVRS
jgi:uncharacterized protein YukE